MRRPIFPARFLAGVVTSVCAALPAQSVAQQTTPAANVSTSRPHDQAPSAIAARRGGSVQIDGRLDESAWQAATPITEFRQNDPNEGQPASERTEARILIDDAAIYVGVRLYDSEPQKIQSQLARRDESIDGMLSRSCSTVITTI